MRSWPVLLTIAAALVLLEPSVAVAGPAAELCTADGSRGGVPEAFVLDACVDGDSLTLRNDLDVAVLIRASGALADPAPVHERGSAAATVLRLAADPGLVLVPGDVVRWQLGPGAADLVVAALEPAAVPAIVSTLEPVLPKLGADDIGVEDFRAFAVVARETAAALEQRAACVPGKNFLGIAACDVQAATAVSRAAISHLPRRPALQVMSAALDAAQWDDWDAAARGGVTARDAGDLRLPVAPKVVAVPSAPPPAVAPAPLPPPLPSPGPLPVPAPPQVPDLGHGAVEDFLDDVLGRPGDSDDEDDEDEGKGKAKGKDD